MHLAEKLYLSGCLTYPRTETTKYAASFDINGPLKALDQTKFGGMS
jgi:DNA topoisomerase-3